MSMYYSISFNPRRERCSSRGVDENARFVRNDGMDFELDPIFVTACACALARDKVGVRLATASITGLSSLLDRCISLVVVWYLVMGIE